MKTKLSADDLLQGVTWQVYSCYGGEYSGSVSLPNETEFWDDLPVTLGKHKSVRGGQPDIWFACGFLKTEREVRQQCFSILGNLLAWAMERVTDPVTEVIEHPVIHEAGF